MFCGKTVYSIDETLTIITSIKNNIAKGYLLNKDLTLTPCYIVRKGNYFAHGETIKKAVRDVLAKELNNMPVEEKIEEFKIAFPDFNKKYPAKEFHKWHGILTGSCEFGRDSFINNNQIDLNELYSVSEFIEFVKNEYGSEIIKKLKEK